MRVPLLLLILILGFANLGFAPPAVTDVREGGLPIYTSQVGAIKNLDLPGVSAEALAIIDGETGQLVAGREPHRRLAPASTTKMVTAIVALERGTLDEMVQIGVDSRDMPDSSVMGLVRGDRVSLYDLLHGLLLPSGNDAALAIADSIGGDEASFVELMNAKVEELGLRDTHFVNPHGLDDPDHYSSAHDLTVLARFALRNQTFAEIVRKTEYTARGERNVYRMVNTNQLLANYEGADGVKTGFTENAMQVLVSSAARDGRRVLAAVIRSEDRFADTIPLLDYYFANYSPRTLDLPATPLSAFNLADGSSLSLTTKPSPSLVLPLWQWRYVRSFVWLDGKAEAPQTSGQRLGFVAYYIGNRLLTEVPVYARP